MAHMQQKPDILVVEDQEVNRRIMTKILEDGYGVCCAGNGREALTLLQQADYGFAAIVLDVCMPEMDGYAFLQERAKLPALRGIPVLVTTASNDPESEDRCLELGAWDFIPKPYNARTVRLRLANIIARSREGLLERLEYVTAHDSVTGLYNRQEFFAQTQTLLAAHPDERFALVRLDIIRFRLINSLYGVAEGDRLLTHIAGILRRQAALCADFCCGRVEADRFCLCEPYTPAGLHRQLTAIESELRAFPASYYIEPFFGVYLIDDRSLDTEAMYLRASLVSRACKGRGQAHIAFFTDSMTRALQREKQITSDMQRALQEEQFFLVLQPKYDLRTGRPCGAEVLTRWQHPQRGLIPPDEFIPLFEHNGFIGQLDYYMWEQTCRLLHAWRAAGASPQPLSVNISRANLYNPQLVRQLLGLTRKYGIPPALLHLELTESAYMDNPEQMKRTVMRLRDKGFLVLMDDFGKGYSSLNLLREVPIDVLKVDIAFLTGGGGDTRGRAVLTAIVQMAHALRMPTVVEGVETAGQRDFLCGIGCDYAQGFFYSRPLPPAEYERLAGLCAGGAGAQPPSAAPKARRAPAAPPEKALSAPARRRAKKQTPQ